MIEPKPFITRKDYFNLPESQRPKFGQCAEHGEFEIKCDESLPIKIIMSTCPKCSEDYSEWKLKQEEVEKKKRDEETREIILKSRLLKSGVSERHFNKSFDNYIADTKEKKYSLDSMRYFVEKVLDGECKNMILCGSVGTGKTHLCQATLRYIVENTNDCYIRIRTIKEIIRHVRSTWSKESEIDEQGAINQLSNMQLLIIDEMGVQSGSDNELDIIFEIINNRYENKLPTVIVSNLEKKELINLLGQRIIDRLKEDGCRVLGMAWDSYRETNKQEF